MVAPDGWNAPWPSAGGKVGHNFAHKRLGTRVEDVARDSTVMGARRPLCRFRSGSRLQPVKFFQSLRQGHPPGYRTTESFCRQKCVGICNHVFEPKTPPSNFLGVTHDKTPQTAIKSRET